MKLTLISRLTGNQPWSEKKNSFCTFGINFDFKGNLNYSVLINFTLSSQCLAREFWKGVDCLCKDFLRVFSYSIFSWDCLRTRSASMLYLLIKNAWSMKTISKFFSCISPYKTVRSWISCSKVDKIFSVTPGKSIYCKISQYFIPVAADNFPLLPFCWLFFCLEYCWRCYINKFTL